jgi:hypothetical protein
MKKTRDEFDCWIYFTYLGPFPPWFGVVALSHQLVGIVWLLIEKLVNPQHALYEFELGTGPCVTWIQNWALALSHWLTSFKVR